jgi:hypothetical protein
MSIGWDLFYYYYLLSSAMKEANAKEIGFSGLGR